MSQGRDLRTLHAAALIAFATDVLLFWGLMQLTEGMGSSAEALRWRIALQYFARAANAGLIATVLVVTDRIRLPELGLSLRDFAADLRWLLKVVLVLLGVSVVGMALAAVVVRLSDVSLAGWPLETRAMGWGGYLLNGVLLAPFVEELVYRSLMIPGLRARFAGRGATIAAGAIVFYVLHLVYAQPPWMVHYLVAGGILTWAYLERGKLWICVALHLGGNAMVLIDDVLLACCPEAFKAIVGRLP